MNPHGPAPTSEFLPPGRISSQSLNARSLRPKELDTRTIEAWAELAQRSADCNPFLSPDFVLPALTHLTPAADARIVLVETTDADPRLLALGVFEQVPPSRFFPLPHLRAYRSPHSFLTGVLLDAESGGIALDVLLAHLKAGASGTTAVHWSHLASDSALCKALRASSAWHEHDTSKRAFLVPPDCGEAFLAQHLSATRQKNLRRRKRHLEQIAPQHWRIRRGAQVDEQCIDTFLRLEDTGWRNAHGCSLRTMAGHEAFFRAMATSFALDGRIFFAELVLGDKVIASSSNLLQGNAAFAFKLGWDAAYANMAPGMLNEVELVKQLPEQFPGLAYLDSCATPGSFLEELYRGRREIVSGCYALSGISGLLLRWLEWARRLKRAAMRRHSH